MSFIDELIHETEIKDKKVLADLLLQEISEVTTRIKSNFSVADEEVKLIQGWLLKTNTTLSEKLERLEAELEGLMQDLNEKTVDLPRGTIKYHKKPDSIEVDEGVFMENPPVGLLKISEIRRPDLNAIKQFIKTHPIPDGVQVVEGKRQLSYILKGGNNGKA